MNGYRGYITQFSTAGYYPAEAMTKKTFLEVVKEMPSLHVRGEFSERKECDGCPQALACMAGSLPKVLKGTFGTKESIRIGCKPKVPLKIEDENTLLNEVAQYAQDKQYHITDGPEYWQYSYTATVTPAVVPISFTCGYPPPLNSTTTANTAATRFATTFSTPTKK